MKEITIKKPRLKNYNTLRKMEWQLHLIILLPIIFLIVFSFVPMFGIRLAFVETLDYKKGIWGSKYVGLYWFRYMFESLPEFSRAFRNTLIIATAKLVLGFPVPVLVTLLLNEVRVKKYKKWMQTLYFLPYFFSWIILCGMIKTIFQQGGIFDRFIQVFGGDSRLWLQDNLSFVLILIFTDIWKGFGYGTIVYLAAVTGIDPTLYEAAQVDGANKFRQAISITLPGIMPMIILILILNIGSVLNANFDQIVNLYNPKVYEWGDIIDTLVYRMTLEGTSSASYPLGTAVGLFKSVISLILIVTSNILVKKTTEYRVL